MDYGLGRIHVPDGRDAAFPASLHLVTLGAPQPPVTKSWLGPVLRIDQGNVGACVGFAAENWKGASPIRDPVSNAAAMVLYNACKAIDGITQEGTSDRFLAKVLVAQGRIEGYLWATTPAEFLGWLSYVGPVMVGTNWYTGMFTPSVFGTIRPTGAVEGGHEYLVRRLDIQGQRARIRNSWGPGWGLHGEAWISLDDLWRLVFQEQGDALCAAEKRP